MTPDGAVATRPSIDTIEDLRTHLQWAIELEHATLPPYLCALYSLDPKSNPDAYAVIGGVFVEEMLHLALAANVLNAVGGKPRIDSADLLPPFPRGLPHGDQSLSISLAPFDREALETLLQLERPAAPSAPAESDRYETIGQFYAAISDGLQRLCETLGEREVFSGDPARQVTAEHVSHSAAGIVAVHDLASALAALVEIVDQGEGASSGEVWDGDRSVIDPARAEVAHYYRLLELKFGRRYQPGDTPESGPTGEVLVVDFDAVTPMRRNPRLDDHEEGHQIRVAQDGFNISYRTVLFLLDEAFNGNPKMLGDATRSMYALRTQAKALMTMPDGGGHVAGPTFDYAEA